MNDYQPIESLTLQQFVELEQQGESCHWRVAAMVAEYNRICGKDVQGGDFWNGKTRL